MPGDTHPKMEAELIRRLRQVPIWRKLALMAQLNNMARAIALSGLRERYPTASEVALKRRLVALLYGEDLAERVYGPLTESEE